MEANNVVYENSAENQLVPALPLAFSYGGKT